MIIERKFLSGMVMERSYLMEQSAKDPPMRSRLDAAPRLAAIALAVCVFCLLTTVQADDKKPVAPGLGDPGQLAAIGVETGRLKDGLVTISGRDSGQQLVVTGQYTTGQTRDLTRKAEYDVSPAGIVSVDGTGLITPIAEGEATMHVSAAAGIDANVKVKVTNLVQDLPVNFANQVTPLFTKYSCNGGGCHGKSGGQNGFRLSLLGFEPKEDYEYLVKEGRGRRLFPGAPDQSLLLLKATARLPHGGGQRIEFDSPAYRLMRRWIEQGMPYGKDSDPKVTHIEVLPPERRMEREGKQQIIVIDAAIKVAIEIGKVFDHFNAALLKDFQIEIRLHALNLTTGGESMVAANHRQRIAELETALLRLLRHTKRSAVLDARESELRTRRHRQCVVDKVTEAEVEIIDVVR